MTILKNKYNEDLGEIIKLIENYKGKVEDEQLILDKFESHIEEIISIGHFSKETWDCNWRKTVYNFGTKFKYINPINFLNLLTRKKENHDREGKEVLDFYYSEIETNSLPNDMCEKKMEELINNYPYNPEFRHTLGHYYRGKKEYEKAIEQYRFALKNDKQNSFFIDTLFTAYYSYLESFIEDSLYEKGMDLCEKLLREGLFDSVSVYRNQLISAKERFKDYILLNKKITEAEIKIKEILSKETNRNQLKIIEILGFFTAIIAFVFSTVSIGKNFDFNEAVIFNISLGFTLLIFALVISLLFSKTLVKWFDFRISLIIIITFCLLLIII